MSNSKRKPLLSNDGILDIVGRGKHLGADVDRATGGLVIRDHYERLIDEGKLRVVEEVAISEEGLMHGRCVGCKYTHQMAFLSDCSYCPGCGQPIKR